MAWIAEAAEGVIAHLHASTYDVVGDLEDLRPHVAEDGRTPDQVGAAELLAAAEVVLGRVGLPAADSLDAALAALSGHLLSAG